MSAMSTTAVGAATTASNNTPPPPPNNPYLKSTVIQTSYIDWAGPKILLMVIVRR